MKIVFPVFVKHSESNKNEGVWGDELIANRFRDMLIADGQECDVVAIDDMEGRHYDVAIWSAYNLTHPAFLKMYADKNILWIQGFNYGEGGIMSIDDIYQACKPHYDLIITSARGLAKKYDIPFVIPGIDLDRYHKPEKEDGIYTCEVSFIGNLIKPFETNALYLSPLSQYDYRLFGGDMGKVNHEQWLGVVWHSQINLHFGFKEGIEWDMVTGSPLFLAASGGFCMSDRIPWFEETFKDAMAFTDGGDEEIEAMEWYLGNRELREKMKARAYEIVRGLDFNGILSIVKGV